MPEEKSTKETKNKDNELVLFAETNFRNQRQKFGIKPDDRRRHMYLIGKTGMGKSTVLENMIISDIRNGMGVAVVDPHGDLAEKIIRFIPNNRINDVVYFNPADAQYPIAFNVMESVSKDQKHLIASGLVGVFKKLWADSWGPRLEYVLRNAILALLDYPDSTLLGVMRILVDKSFRNKVIAKIEDPVVRSFWVDEYSKYPDRFQTEAIAPIQNKVGQFLSTAMVRNIVGQVKSTVNMRDIMDQQKILILNLSKGRIGEDSSTLLGAMIITKIQLAAMSRVEIPEDDRKDFYLYVDEFQNFATESFANILSEARKYRLNLIIAHQYIGQLSDGTNYLIRDAVFGNVGTIMCFRIGAADSEFLVKEFDPYYTENDIINLAKFDVYMKLMIDGISSTPFSATTLPPLDGETGNEKKVIDATREKYSVPLDVVEDKIARWSGMAEIITAKQDNPESRSEGSKNNRPQTNTQPRQENKPVFNPNPTNDKQQPRQNNNSRPPQNRPASKPATPNKPRILVNCYDCGEETEVSFKPDGVRPIYCRDCFKKVGDQVLKGRNVVEDEKPKSVKAPEKVTAKTNESSISQPKSNPSAVPVLNPVVNNPLPKKNTIKLPPNPEPQKSTGTVKPGQIIKLS